MSVVFPVHTDLLSRPFLRSGFRRFQATEDPFFDSNHFSNEGDVIGYSSESIRRIPLQEDSRKRSCQVVSGVTSHAEFYGGDHVRSGGNRKGVGSRVLTPRKLSCSKSHMSDTLASLLMTSLLAATQCLGFSELCGYPICVTHHLPDIRSSGCSTIPYRAVKWSSPGFLDRLVKNQDGVILFAPNQNTHPTPKKWGRVMNVGTNLETASVLLSKDLD